MAMIEIEGYGGRIKPAEKPAVSISGENPEELGTVMADADFAENDGSDTNASDEGLFSSSASSSSPSSPMTGKSEDDSSFGNQKGSDSDSGTSKFDGYVLCTIPSLLPKPEAPPGVITAASSPELPNRIDVDDSTLSPDHREFNRSQSLPETIAVDMPAIGKYIRERSSSLSAAISERFNSFRDEQNDTNPQVMEFNLSGLKVIVNHKREEESESQLKGRITFFSKTDCRDSTAVRSFLREKGLDFVEINLDVYPERTRELVQRADTSQVPQIFFNEKLFGGLVALNSLRNSGGFDQRLKELLGVKCPADAPSPPAYGFEEPEEEWEDEMVAVVRMLRQRLPIQDRLLKMKLVRNCFAGSEVVDVLIHHFDCGRKKATEIGKQLARKHFIHHVFGKSDFEDGNHFYRFLEHGPSISKCYNFIASTNDSEPKSASKVGLKLTKLMSAILESYASNDRCHVDYVAISKSEEFRRYLKLIQEFHRVNLTDLSSDEKLAFFLNLYNAMVIHAIIRLGRPEGIFDRGAFSSDFQYIVGGHPYSLDEIKNGILRSNQRPPYSFIKPFGSGDMRAELSLPKVNPLIHFGLCDGTKSSPKVRFFSPQVVEAQLRDAARDFFKSGSFEVDLGRRTVFLTRIMKWSSVDFGQEKDMLKWTINYLDPNRVGLLMHLLGDGGSIHIVHQNYDWSVNS